MLTDRRGGIRAGGRRSGRATRGERYGADRFTLATLLAIALLLLAPRAEAQCSYDVTWFDPVDCGPFGAHGVSVTGINAYGHLSGWYQNCNGLGDETPFIWTPEGGRQDLLLPAGFHSGRAIGLNNHGVVTGRAHRDTGSPHDVAVVWIDGALTTLGVLPGDIIAEAVAVNDAGLVVGNSFNGITSAPRRGFTWQVGGTIHPIAHPDGQTTIVLEDVNEAGEIAGWTWTPRRGLLIVDGGLIEFDPIPGGFASQFVAINESGSLAGSGWVDDADGSGWHWVAAIWRNGIATLLNHSSSVPSSGSTAMNRWSQVIGSAQQPAGYRGFLYECGLFRMLEDVVTLPAGFTDLGSPSAINDHGVIATTDALLRDAAGVIVILTPRRPAGDATCDCRVGFRDLLAVLTDWGPAAIPMPTDLDRDGAIGLGDLLLVLEGWTTP